MSIGNRRIRLFGVSGVLFAVVIISMHVLTANATYLDDSTANLNVPSDIIKVLLKPHLSLENDGQVIVLIDLQPDDLNSIAVSHNLNLRPVIKAIVE